MPYTELPIPNHFDPSQVSSVWRVPYQQRATQAERWSSDHGIQPASKDSLRICLVAVDVQNTFCIPDFELYVGGRTGTGAVDDNRRLCEFIYRNLGSLTQIYPTMDTHQPLQIFHPIFLVNDRGEHPAPYTLVSVADLEHGAWQFNPAVAASLGVSVEYAQHHLKHYTRALAQGGKYDLTIWPYHALLGGIGHALVSAFEEAAFFHGVARATQPNFQMKGDRPFTEHYSVLGPEVLEDAEGRRISDKNYAFIDTLLDFDAIVIAGQAKSHCVAWTIQDLLDGIQHRDNSLANKVYLLTDCSSPVVVPGTIDYTDQAEAAFRKFAEAGMHLVRSSDPLGTWPGLRL